MTPIQGAVGISVIGSAVSAYGQYQAGQMEARRLRFNALIADLNAINAEYAAKDIESVGRTKERKHRQRVKQFIGRQRATFGGSGVDVTTGAPADLIAESVLHGEDDAATIRRNAAMEAWGMKSRAADIRSQAGQYRIGADVAETAGVIGAGTTLLTGMGSSALTYAAWKGK